MLREAFISDIKQIQQIRNAVKENTLSHPSLVSDRDCRVYITQRGKGWVYELDGSIVGFAIADLSGENVWALFVDPLFENKKIGKKLHDEMLNWYFGQGKRKVWLGTAPSTRAEGFYRHNGWVYAGLHGEKEIKFEMTTENWKRLNPIHEI